MNTFKREISVVIPAFNEEGSIKEMVERLSSSLTKNEFKHELIIVDDNSSDKTGVIAKKLSKKYPVIYQKKEGRKGKAYSLFEGFSQSKYQNTAFIDADLQYPPEEIAKMALKLTDADVIIANRTRYKGSKFRKILSRTFRYGFGKGLFGLDHDIQAGLKVFKKEVIDSVNFIPKSAWTFDLEFLRNANDAGFEIKSHNITFSKRAKGESKIGIVRSIYEIGSGAISLKLDPSKPLSINSLKGTAMRGAGLRHKKKKYITHSTLTYKKSSIITFSGAQKFYIALIVELVLMGLILNPLFTLGLIIAILSFIYFSDTIFNLYVVLKSLHKPQEVTVSQQLIKKLKDRSLPMYTILCPLYKEAHIIPQFIDNISKLSWPKSKLDVLLLLEEDDKESIKKARKMKLPSYVKIIIVPNSQPKTKPKACNYGLSYARGEYLVIYDAEDKPDTDQLKKAYLAFSKLGRNVVCLQAKLNYYNSTQNLLTKFFTAEYSLWFDITLTGLQSIDTSIPLGGTSNHFRTEDIHKLEGWDPFNVTEDADLGMRLFKAGYKTAIIDSLTLEEANSKWGNWIRQRSRWIKGYMQTYLVHTRDSLEFARTKGRHFPIFHLIIGGKIAFILINPVLWVATISYFTLYAYVGPTIERLYPTLVFYMAAFSLVFGNFLFMYYYMVGIMKREQYSLLKYTFLIPIYWLLISVAGFMALYQLIFKPFYWEKTVHGLHILDKLKSQEQSENSRKRSFTKWPTFPMPTFPRVSFPVMRLPRPAFSINFATLGIIKSIMTIGRVEKMVINTIAVSFIFIGEVEKRLIQFVILLFKKLIILPLKYASSIFA